MTKWGRPPGLSFADADGRLGDSLLDWLDDRPGSLSHISPGDRLLDWQGDRPGGLSYLVFDGVLFDVIDNEDVDGSLLLFQLQPQLFLYGGEDGGCVAWCRGLR